MKKICLLFFLASIHLYGEILNLDDCINEAKTNNKKVEVSRSQILFAKAVKRQSLSPLLPHFDVDGRYEFKNKGRDYSIFTQYGSAFSSKTVGVNAQMLLFDFFSTWNIYQSCKSEMVVAQKNLDKQLVSLEEEVKIAYFKVLENESFARVIEDSKNRLEKQMNSVQGSFHQGIASKQDILAVKMQLIEQKKNLLQANSEIFQSKIFLNYLLGREPLSSLKLVDLSIYNYPKHRTDDLMKWALENRSDLQALKEKINALNYLLKSAREAYAPHFFAFGGYQFLEDAPPAPSSSKITDKNWISGGIGMKFSLYDGGKNNTEIRKIKAQITQAKAELDDLEKRVLMEVNQKYLKCNEILENISIDDESVKTAEEKFNFIAERYSQGMDSVDSLLKAEQALINANMNKNQTIYLYHISHANLMAVTEGI